MLTDCQWAYFHISYQWFPSVAQALSRGVRLVLLCSTIHTHLPGKNKSVTQMSPLMIMSGYRPGKDTHTQAHTVSLDPCRIRSCLEQSWLRLGTQPELLQHVSGETERGNRPNWWRNHTGSLNTTHRQLTFLLPRTSCHSIFNLSV